jgi:hypothetical protein
VYDGVLFRLLRLHGELYGRMFGMFGMRQFMFK